MKTNKITQVQVKFTANGALVATVTLEDEAQALTYYDSKGILPDVIKEGALISYEVQESSKGQYTNYYLKLEGDTQGRKPSASPAPKKSGYNDSPYMKPHSPEIQSQIVRQSSLASAADYAGSQGLGPEEVIELAKRFYIYATTGE
jgi:hypothetical protein